jgi:hypothetical protein
MAISSTAILWPMLSLIGLTFFTLFYMFCTRVNYMLANKIHPQRVQSRDGMRQLLQPAATPSDHFNNLLELPLLFYIAVMLIWALQLSDSIYLLMAWLYVCLRLAHSIIHLSYNRVMHRLYAFAASSLVLLLIWLRLALHIIEHR